MRRHHSRVGGPKQRHATEMNADGGCRQARSKKKAEKKNEEACRPACFACSAKIIVAGEGQDVPAATSHKSANLILNSPATMSTSGATEGPSLGVRVSLPPGTLAAQRERELSRRQQQHQLQGKPSQHVLTATDEDLLTLRTSISRTPRRRTQADWHRSGSGDCSLPAWRWDR